MNTPHYMHWFVAGVFVATALSQSILPSIILAILLITIWGNYILPLLMALFIDITFADTRNFSNLFGFMYTTITLVLTALFLSLRKFLKF